MTTPSDNEIFEAYVPVYDTVPERWEDARPFIVEQLKKISTAINIREIGWFLDEELLSGKAFIPGLNSTTAGQTGQNFRSILRKVIDFGPLPDTTSKSVPHGINADENFTLIQIWAAATDPTNFKIPIPFASPNALSQNILLRMNPTDVIIVTGSDRTNFTRCFVVIEYIQEL